MKFLFAILFFISLEQMTVQQPQRGENLRGPMLIRAKMMEKDSKEAFFKSLSTAEIDELVCFKEKYLSKREKNTTSNVSKSELAQVRKEFPKIYKNMSSQVLEDALELVLKFHNEAIDYGAGEMFYYSLRRLGAYRFVLNATYVEQKQKEYAKKWSPVNYEFLRTDYNECCELLKMDLSKELAPDTVSRIMSLRHMVYGSRKEIETALSYMYGSAVNTPTNATT